MLGFANVIHSYLIEKLFHMMHKVPKQSSQISGKTNKFTIKTLYENFEKRYSKAASNWVVSTWRQRWHESRRGTVEHGTLITNLVNNPTEDTPAITARGHDTSLEQPTLSTSLLHRRLSRGAYSINNRQRRINYTRPLVFAWRRNTCNFRGLLPANIASLWPLLK